MKAVALFVLVAIAVVAAHPVTNEGRGKCTWKLFLTDDFKNGAHGWSKNAVTTCGGTKILGGYGKFSRDEVYKTFLGLPDHSHVRIKSNYYFIDSWDRETGYLKLDDTIVWTKIMEESSKGVNACGGDYTDQIAWPVDVIIPHTRSSLDVTFGANLDEDPKTESWGVSDVLLYICATCQEEAKSCN